MAKRKTSEVFLSAQNTISIGTAITAVKTVIAGVWYLRGWVAELDELKNTVAYMRPVVDDIKRSIDQRGSTDVPRKGRK